MKSLKAIIITSLVAGLGLAQGIQADQRHFSYSYDADSILPKGRWEVESYATQKTNNDKKTQKWELRQELEYGLTDRLTTALYLNSKFENKDGEKSGKLEGISSEWKYMVLSPNTNPLGVMFYGELTAEEGVMEFEEKLILTHRRQDWNFSTNIVYEQELEFEGNRTDVKTKVKFTGGASYKITPRWHVGVEGRTDLSNRSVFLGPVIQHESSNWFTILTALKRVSDMKQIDDVEVRWIIGFMLPK